MNCPKCGAQKMNRDKPVYYNKENREGDFLYCEEIYACHLCGKVIFVHRDFKITEKKFINGQVITQGYENL